MAVGGELVQAGVGAHDERVADLGPHGRDRPVEDAVLGPGPRAGLVAGRGHAEQVDGPHAGCGAGGGLAAHGVQRVLPLARHGADGPGLGDVLADEDGADERGGADPRLGDQAAHDGGGAQPAGADRGGRRRRHAPLGQEAGGGRGAAGCGGGCGRGGCGGGGAAGSGGGGGALCVFGVLGHGSSMRSTGGCGGVAPVREPG